ncbi:hypothetical protein CSOJ01_13169 [Colletotrichum sojae]|uniref:Uncharacterized protein n=1 Tax=Colletotrichum sojae TaxID=2175907 RepID=A0A8H6IU08_9PEZI|nr:hypothetical protein CSOJ01_13169 [Colletotrichum sojae]
MTAAAVASFRSSEIPGLGASLSAHHLCDANTKATAIGGIGLARSHATLFKLNQNTLVPLELAAGLSPVEAGAGPAANVPAAFLSAIAEYLARNELADILDLEVEILNEENTRGCEFMNELEVQWGAERGSESFTILLPRNARTRGDVGMGALTPTGWYANSGSAPADPDQVRPGTHYEKVVVGLKETHKVIVTGGGSSAAVTPTLVLGELANNGLIALDA